MENRNYPCATVEVINVQSCTSIPVPQPTPAAKPTKSLRCNLIQNHSFEKIKGGLRGLKL